ncbi:hypothetical protein [Micromonospora echinospora]|uniref:hypothetical protein n=1 Tax=Micromonospora echinospora TaxID=1877 RepID=UPI003A84214D
MTSSSIAVTTIGRPPGSAAPGNLRARSADNGKSTTTDSADGHTTGLPSKTGIAGNGFTFVAAGETGTGRSSPPDSAANAGAAAGTPPTNEATNDPTTNVDRKRRRAEPEPRRADTRTPQGWMINECREYQSSSQASSSHASNHRRPTDTGCRRALPIETTDDITKSSRHRKSRYPVQVSERNKLCPR